MSIRTWLYCTFGHAPRVRERDAQGRAQLVCPDCRDPIYLDSQAEFPKGPRHEPEPVLGQPKFNVKRMVKFGKQKVG